MNLNRYLDIWELDYLGFVLIFFFIDKQNYLKLSVVSIEANATSSRVAEMGGP